MNLGKKIVIVGVSASGKSTFARKLGEKLDRPVIFMDSIMWKPGWNYIGDEETAQKLKAISDGEEWIIEGYITTKARTFLFERADTIIYLCYPRIVGVWRYLKRWWFHRHTPRPELEGSPDTFDFNYLKLIWRRGEAVTLDKYLKEVSNQQKIIKLASPREARLFLEKI